MFEWLDIWTENNPRTSKWRELEKNLSQRVQVGEGLEGRESLGSGSQSSGLLGM